MSPPPPADPQPDPTHASPDDAPGLRRLLVGYDGSDCAAAATAFGLWLAGKAHARATLVHVSPDLSAAHTAHPDALSAAADQQLAGTSEWLERLEAFKDFAGADIEVDCAVVHGHPAGALLAEAAARDADFLVVGSTGVGALRGGLLGSVSSQVVHHAHCPVMVFRAGQPASARHVQSVVVGVDGSPGSRHALTLAAQMAEGFAAKLVLVYTCEPVGTVVAPTPEILDDIRRHGTRVLKEARRSVEGSVDVLEVLAEGRPRHALVEACHTHGPAVLAVGSRGHGGFTRLLLGSTSEWVLNHAPCPVLVARGPAA